MGSNSFTTVQFEPTYDVYKMRTLVDDLERQFRALGLEFESSLAGIHNTLTGRDAADCHPISAITGLTAALLAIGVTLGDHETRITTNESDISSIFIELDRNRIERYFLGE